MNKGRASSGVRSFVFSSGNTGKGERVVDINEDVKYGRESDKRNKHIGRVVDGGLVNLVERDGLRLTGFTLKCAEYDCLLVVKAVGEGGSVVAFIGSESIGGVWIKAFDQAKNGGLKWRADKWVK
jgi:hypothetical protein